MWWQPSNPVQLRSLGDGGAKLGEAWQSGVGAGRGVAKQDNPARLRGCWSRQTALRAGLPIKEPYATMGGDKL